jgi:hypothetical protein
MSGHTPRPRATDDWRSDVQNHAYRLDQACREEWGVTITMFRGLKFLFHIVTLVFTVYLIELTTITPTVAVGVAVLLIAGPEGFEAYLVRQGYIEDADTATSDSASDTRETPED